jgi:ABC-type proline/glycine betaine transport system permease subunit
MANPEESRKHSAWDWLILMLVVLGVALIGGVPLGIWVALNTWLEWTVWAVPLLLGVLTFTIGATILTWDQVSR